MILKNGFVIDGSGNPGFKANVRIEDDRIAEIGRLISVEGEETIDATGLVVSPGFIDVHAHSDYTLLANSLAESKVRQGVTTEINGNCGSSAAPLSGSEIDAGRKNLERLSLELDWAGFGEYLDRLEKQGLSLNVVTLVGHGTLRSSVMGSAARSPTQEELKRMKGVLAQAMEEGAFGLSTGLEFAPGRYSEMDELIELCRVVAEHGGLYATHQRNRDIRYEEATAEAIEVGEKTGVPVHLSHFVVRFPGEGKTPALLWMLDEARKKGIDLTCDVIVPCDAPRSLRLRLRDGYHWAAQSLAPQLIPPWGFEGGTAKTLARLRDPEIRRKFREEHVPQWKLFGAPKEGYPEYPEGIAPKWDRLLLNYCRACPELNGKTFSEIAEIKGMDPWDAALDVVMEEGEQTGSFSIPILGATTAERDSIRVMQHPTASLCSDRSALAPYGVLAEGAEPNSYGAFPRVYRKYVRERGILSLEETVRKMSSVPAQQFGLWDRGIIRKGMKADLVLFDPEHIGDRATIEEPAQYPEGIEYVIVNGALVLEKGEHTGARPGQVLRKNTT